MKHEMPLGWFLLIVAVVIAGFVFLILAVSSSLDKPSPAKPLPYCRVVQPVLPSPTPNRPPTIQAAW